MLDEQSLQKKKTEIEKCYAELDAKRREIINEMVRLEGEHRLIVEFLKKKEPTPMIPSKKKDPEGK